MAIMKLSNVPELTEFAGTEKIYVNDNGETKQISCDKVVTGGGGGVFIIDSTAVDYSTEDRAYGNKIRDAFFGGMVIYYYNGYAYYVPSEFDIWGDETEMVITVKTIARGGSGDIITNYSANQFVYSFVADPLK
jgi:hypothetical protein